MTQQKRMRALPLALFFYKVEPTQEQVANIDQYFIKSGYYVAYRKQIDPVGRRDIIESTGVCFSGAYPTIYTEKFTGDVTRVLDTTPIASIMDGTAEKAPVPTSPREQANRMAAPASLDVSEQPEVQTIAGAVAPLAPVKPPAP